VSDVSALQATLAAEHAAVYVYGVLGGRTSQSRQADLFAAVTAAHAEHRSRRDELSRMIRDLGAEPVASAAAYALDPVPTSAAQVRRAAQDVESASAQSYALQVAGTAAGSRRWAITALTDAAVRRRGFGGAPEAFPGATELGGE
jgi:hypothetical protein